MIGRTELLLAQRKLQILDTERHQALRAQALSERYTKLGDALIQAAFTRVPRTHCGITLELSKKSAQKQFNKYFELSEDFPAQNISLVIRNDYDTWANFYPFVNIPGAKPVHLPSYSAHSHGRIGYGSNAVVESPTKLFIQGEDIVNEAVEYNSEAYRYIQTVSGLFMPEIIKQA